MSLLCTYDGYVAVSEITLIESQSEENGLPYHVVHYRHPSGETRSTRSHPDYVSQILHRV